MDDAASALVLCAVFVAGPVGMVAGAVLASRLRQSTRWRGVGKLLGAASMLVAWEITWLGLLVHGALYVGAWVVLQPVGFWLIWRAVRGDDARR